MLKKFTVICGLMLAMTTAVAWRPLADVPAPAAVERGDRITWGNGIVWGLFPTRDSGETYVQYFQPDWPGWYTGIEEIGTYLIHTGLTFQWIEQPVLFAIGEDTSVGQEDTLSTLYWYVVNKDQWGYEDIDQDTEFVLGNGTCIAFVPNSGWDVWSDAVPGWIYCLPGGGREFWRYNIGAESIPDISLYGHYPGPNATIADQTPPFKWSEWVTPTQYRIQVSTNQFFLGNVIDTVLSSPQYEPTTKLDNGTYYWRTAAWTGLGWSWSSTHSFMLQGGWEQCESIPAAVGTGAAMAFDADAFIDSALIVLRGGGNRNFYEYNIESGHWIDTLQDAPVNVIAGTSLSTHDPTGEWAAHPVASFGGSGTSDCPYHYHPDWGDSAWVPFDTTDTNPDWNSHFPEELGSDASMVQGDSHMCYLVVGDENFYRLEPPAESRGGGQAGAMRSGKVNAHVVHGLDVVEVEYQLPASCRVRARLHDAIGRQVAALDAGEQTPGKHRLIWTCDSEGKKLSAGAYFVLLDAGGKQGTLKAAIR